MNRRALSLLMAFCLITGTLCPAIPAMGMEADTEIGVSAEVPKEDGATAPDDAGAAGENNGAAADSQTTGPDSAGGEAVEVPDSAAEASGAAGEGSGMAGGAADTTGDDSGITGEASDTAGESSDMTEEGSETGQIPEEAEEYGQEEPQNSGETGEGSQDSAATDAEDPSAEASEEEIPADEAETEEEIPLTVLELPETEIITFSDPAEYARAVSALTSEFSVEEATLVVDTATGQVTTGTGEVLERTGEAVAEAAALPAAEAAEVLSDTAYEVISVSGDEVVISDPYAMARLLVTSDSGVDTSGAVLVLNYENEYILQYATSGDAAQASDLLAGTVDCLEQDIPLDIADDDEWIYEAEAWFDEAETSLAVGNSATGEQGMFENQENYLSWAVPYLGIDQVLADYAEENAQEIVVAVIDSGFDDVPGFFSDERVLEPLTVAENGDTSDVNARRHGTFVLGEIYEATPSNVKLLPVRAYNADNKMSMSTLMSALRLIQNYDTHVSLVNMSIGTFGDQGIAYTGTNPDVIFKEMTEAGTFFTGSAGNNQTSLKECYPAKSRYVCAVTAIDEEGLFADSFSNYGEEDYPVAFSAPGALMQGVSPLSQINITTMKGTSMASPYVLTTAAILMSQGKLAGLTSASAFEAALGNYVKADLTAGTDANYYGAGCVGFPADFGFASVSAKSYYYNNGNPVRPAGYSSPGITVKAGTDILVNDVDYTVAYENNVEPGIASFTVTGRGLYEGELTGSFKIFGKISDCEISVPQEFPYSGEAITPEPVVTFHGKTLVKDTDYTVSWENNVEAGQATVTVTGMGFYRLTASASFSIISSLEGCEIAPIEDLLCTESALEPDPAITLRGTQLVRDRDYTLIYADNILPGTATITVEGIGYYRTEGDPLTVTFRILLGTPVFQMTNEKNGVKLTWNRIDGADGYILYRRGGRVEDSGSFSRLRKITNPDTLAYTDKSAESGKYYTYTVRAYSAGVNGKCEPADFYRIAGVAAKAANTSTGIKISWARVNGAGGYYVYRRKTSESSYTKIGRTSATRLYYVDKNTVNGTRYRYCVKPYYGSYTAPFHSSTLFTCVNAVGIASASSSSPGKVLVKWNKNTKATGYQVRYACNSSFTDPVTVKVKGAASLSKTLTGLRSGKKVYLKVRAYRKVDGKNYYSAWSAATAVRVK